MQQQNNSTMTGMYCERDLLSNVGIITDIYNFSEERICSCIHKHGKYFIMHLLYYMSFCLFIPFSYLTRWPTTRKCFRAYNLIGKNGIKK